MSARSKKNSDIIVIGGGVIGMSIARELKKRGAGRVTLLERGSLGAEASFAAAGMLTPQADAEKHDDFFDLCYEARGRYETFADELKAESGIDVELETSGTLSISFNEQDSARLEKIFRWQSEAGYPVEKLSAADVLTLEPSLSPLINGGLFFPRDVQVENRLLVRALAISLKNAGVEIFENSEVESLLLEGGKITGAQTPDTIFSATAVVLATGAWSSLIRLENDASPLVDVFPVRGQMLCFQPAEKLFTRVIISSEGYLVPRKDGRILAGATVENVGFNKNVTTEGVQFLQESTYEMSPVFKNVPIAETWAGLRPCAPDKLPLLGEHPGINNLFVATAHFRNGILLAPITAEITADRLIDAKESGFLEKFGPGRFGLKAVA